MSDRMADIRTLLNAAGPSGMESFPQRTPGMGPRFLQGHSGSATAGKLVSTAASLVGFEASLFKQDVARLCQNLCVPMALPNRACEPRRIIRSIARS